MKYNLEDLPYRESTHAVIFDSENNLLIVHKINYEPEDWAFPGGGIELGEDSKQAVERELKEEIGLDQSEYEILYKSNYDYKYDWDVDAIEQRFKKDHKYYRGQILFQYIVKISKVKPEINIQKSELNEFKWIPRNSISDYIRNSEAQDMLKKLFNEYDQKYSDRT